MIASMIVPAVAYQSAFKSGAAVTTFSQTAKDKMAAMEDGDNIFALGDYDTATYTTPAAYTESGLCQFVYQHNNDKWGRALQGNTWAISGMANVGDGVIDTALSYNKDGILYFGVKKETKVDPDGNTGTAGAKYDTLCGWEFAADFRVKSFKIYIGQNAYLDDFDILIGHLEGDDIVWEVAFDGYDMKTRYTAVPDTTNALYSYEATFDKIYTGRFIQIADKSLDGHAAAGKSEYKGYIVSEFEVYSAGPAHNHTFVNGVCTECGCLASGSDISSAADFAKMLPDGTYNIAADFTVSESYANGFNGVINGNGHTITATAPLFNVFTGTISDLTIDADIESGAMEVGAIAGRSRNITAENVTVTGSVTATAGYAGGLVGFADNATFNGCKNDADVTALYGAGGIAAAVGKVSTTGSGADLDDCANYGDITSTATSNGAVGGLIGWIGAKNNSRVSTFDNCANYGDVTGASSSSYPAAGILGYGYGTKGASYPKFTDCLNSGDITNNSTIENSFAAQIVGYCNCKDLAMNNCFCLGTTTADAGQTVVCGVSSAVPTDFANINVYFYGEEGTNYAPEFFTWSNGTEGNRLALADASGWGEAIEVTAEQFASGEVACDINTKAGKILVGQNIDNGETADAKPVLNGAKVYDLGEGKYSNYENGAPTFSAQIGVGDNISIIITVEDASAVTVKDADENAVDLTLVSSEKEYVYRIYDVTPQMMSDVFTITVGDADPIEFSIRDYCMALLEKNAANTDLCNYVKALLHYGAATQTYASYNTENLADADIDAASDPVLLTETSKNWTANGDYEGAVEVTAAGMYIDYRTSLYFKTSGTGNVTYIIDKSFEKKATTELDGAVGAVFAELNLAELGKVYNVTVFDGDDIVGTLTYSGLSFIYSNQNRTDARGAFAKAMLNLYRATLPMFDA